jgi:hypothetical protein
MGKRKVGNRPESDVCRRSATWRWKVLKESYKIASDLILIRGLSKKLWMPKSPGSPNRDSFGTSPWESWEKVPFRCSLRGELQRILYGGRWWLPPSLGRGESSESKLPVARPNTKGVPECELTNLGLVLDARLCNKIIGPLPNLILEPHHAPLPLLVLRIGNVPQAPNNSVGWHF